jgi:hypothetical protein
MGEAARSQSLTREFDLHRDVYFGGVNPDVMYRPPNTTFDLHAFSFACSAGIPQPPCVITVKGSKANGQVVQKVVTFPRLDPGHVAADFVMNKTTFSKFNNLKSLTFSTANGDDGSANFGGLMLDNIQYTTKERVC